MILWKLIRIEKSGDFELLSHFTIFAAACKKSEYFGDFKDLCSKSTGIQALETKISLEIFFKFHFLDIQSSNKKVYNSLIFNPKPVAKTNPTLESI